MDFAPKFFINPKIEIRNSKIGGRGLFVKEKIKSGEIIHIAEGNILTLEELEKLPREQQWLCYDVDDSHVLCPKDFNNLTPDWYINHSCDPNCGATPDWFTLVAMRDIEPDEEITYDYAMTNSRPDWFMRCNCGARNCRRIITGNDWKIKELQERYVGYFQENIRQKIKTSGNYILVPDS